MVAMDLSTSLDRPKTLAGRIQTIACPLQTRACTFTCFTAPSIPVGIPENLGFGIQAPVQVLRPHP